MLWNNGGGSRACRSMTTAALRPRPRPSCKGNQPLQSRRLLS